MITKKWPFIFLCSLFLTLGVVNCSSASSQKRSVGQVLDDAMLTTKIKTKLLAKKDIKGLKIDVDTRNGEVTLSGDVESSAQEAFIVDYVSGIKGVRSVNPNFTYVTRSTVPPDTSESSSTPSSRKAYQEPAYQPAAPTTSAKTSVNSSAPIKQKTADKTSEKSAKKQQSSSKKASSIESRDLPASSGNTESASTSVKTEKKAARAVQPSSNSAEGDDETGSENIGESVKQDSGYWTR